MITTQTNLRATATEAYLKGHDDGARAVRQTVNAYTESRLRQQGAATALLYTADELKKEVEFTRAAVEEASTRWAKRIWTGRLEGLEFALSLVRSQA